MERSVWIGFDPREADGYAVTRTSLERNLNRPTPVRGLVLSDLQEEGIYTRPTETREGRLFDVVSNHPMATQFAISRFFVPYLVRRSDARNGRHYRNPTWALFMDSDMLVLEDVNRLFDLADPQFAVQVVKHQHEVAEGLKMDGQVQSSYTRKNWSSVILFNVNHPAHDALDLPLLNSTRGLSLHQFSWIPSHLIGEISPRWNYLEGFTRQQDLMAFGDDKPSIIHFTEGLPSMGDQYAHTPHAKAWFQELARWAA